MTKRKQITTPHAILSYPHLFEPQPAFGDPDPSKAKYACVLVFRKDADLSELQAFAREIGRGKWGAKFEELFKSGKIRSPFRDDVESKGYPQDTVCFINAKSPGAPGVVSKYAGPDGKPSPITDESEVYAGCSVRATVSCYADDHPAGGKGLAFGLGNVQKLDDGPRLDGKSRAEDDFEALESQPAAMETEEMGIFA